MIAIIACRRAWFTGLGGIMGYKVVKHGRGYAVQGPAGHLITYGDGRVIVFVMSWAAATWCASMGYLPITIAEGSLAA